MEKYSPINYVFFRENTNKGPKIRLKGIIFARAISSIGILCFHFFCQSKGKFKLCYKTANSHWGFIFVTVFFSISGSVLYYNYPKVNSLKIFFFKRWKSILLPYYICFFYFFLQKAFFFRKLFFRGHWSKLIFTLFGLDGYLSRMKLKTYFLIGQWFLGAIIIIYFLYPILSWLMNKNILIIHFIILFCYPLMYYTNIFTIIPRINMITSINSFYFGMLGIIYHDLFFSKIGFVISLIIFIFLYFIKISKIVLIHQMQGFSLYIILVQIGKKIMKSEFKQIILEINNLSYYIFLLHHKIIFAVLNANNPDIWYLQMEFLLITIILTIISSKIVYIIINYIYNNNLFKKIDSFFLRP
jgi:hypothetical protein